MLNIIGNNAGIIWHMLLRNGRITLEEIYNLTDFDDHYILLSLGWLAKENKIDLTMRDGYIYAELTHSASEYYF